MAERMVRVQMLEYVSGGRYDGTEWPPAGCPLVVPYWEAQDLYAGRLARPWPGGDEVADPEPDKVPEPEPGPAAEAEPAAEPEPEPEVPDAANAPRPAAPKADWIAWAVRCGVSEDEANGMSKAELMEKYGGRA